MRKDWALESPVWKHLNFYFLCVQMWHT